MYTGRILFAQLLDCLPTYDFHTCVRRYHGHRRVRRFSCRDQFLCMVFAQLAYRESLRDIETCLRALQPKLYHAGIRATMAKSTLAEANERRDWRIYADFAQMLIARARQLYAGDDFGVALAQTAYVFDSTTIDLCLTLFPWAHFRQRKAAVTLHTLLDLRGNIPSFIHMTDVTTHDVTVLDRLRPEPGAFYVMDRGYIDFRRLYVVAQRGAFFVVRAKRNLAAARRTSRPIDKTTGLRSDQTIVLTGPKSSQEYPDPLRRISYVDPETRKRFVFLTNSFTLRALAIAQLYKCRWQVELFFKWIKQYLRIKAFYGTSANAVKTPIWIAISVYVLVAIVKKRLKLDRSLGEILQILSVTLFEKDVLFRVLTTVNVQTETQGPCNQLNLFDL
ncbi:MAG: IS4 family transposase [Nitrospirae bacterium]|nr:MAG: IS4 family transposase [Nitrospirota bacterium]